MKRITIKEIAKRAGVSIGTVDRVLHNRGEVAAKTKELVLKIANEGNYTTNVYARSLKLNKIYRIAVLLPKDNEYWSTLNKAINKTAERYASLGIHPEFFTFDRHSQASLLQQAQQMLASEPDGVILAPLVEDEIGRLTKTLENRDVPYVYVDSNLEASNPLAFIGQDSFQAGYLASKLLNLGFPNGHSAYIARFFDFDSLNKTIEERIKGFRGYYKDNAYDTRLIHDVDLSRGVQEFLKRIQEEASLGPVHIFIPNSRAHQLVNERNGFEGQLRIVGFDLIGENKACLARNTIDFVIDQNPSKQGELALQAFYDRLIANTEVRTNQLMALEIFTKENLQDQ